jgi:hypothetical protein
MKVTVFWDVALCSVIEEYRRFRGACCFYHQGDDGGIIPENSHLQQLLLSLILESHELKKSRIYHYKRGFIVPRKLQNYKF